ncbi:MAG: right-handed parallel beta-helix repeat-containing protein, partial [Planctomycetota bacterium]
VLSGCDVLANECFGDGGGVDLQANAATITNCAISGNLAHDNGGGILMGCATVTVCTVANNQSFDHGGGIYVKDASSALITGCVISNNYAVDGGGIGFNTASNGVVVRNSYLYMNHAYQDGGGMRCKIAGPVIENCIVTLNEANLDGGGIECCYTSAPIIRSCSMIENAAHRYGGGIAVTAESAVSITNCILWTNSAASGGAQSYHDWSSTFAASWSVVQDWTLGGDGMSSNDPCLVPISCRLTTNSIWCIDHGISNAVLADWEGEAGWNHSGVTNVWTNWFGDIGADEFVDANSNGMADAWEIQEFGSTTNPPGAAAADWDSDGLANLQEYELGTSPLLADTDGDGLTDSNEVYGVLFNGTNCYPNPLSSDTDRDGMNDFWEIASATNRLDPHPTVSDPLGDPDYDGVINAIEAAGGTDACWFDDPGNKVSVLLKVGDSGSMAGETYALRINGSDVLTAPAGGTTSQAFNFPKGGEYHVTLNWLAGLGDYDYQMKVDGMGLRTTNTVGDLPALTNWLWDADGQYCIYDDRVILGEYQLEGGGTNNPTTLYPDGVPGERPYEAILYVPKLAVMNVGKNPLPPAADQVSAHSYSITPSGFPFTSVQWSLLDDSGNQVSYYAGCVIDESSGLVTF